MHSGRQILNDILVGLADDPVRITERRSVDKGVDRPCVWDKTVLCGTVIIRMCGQIGQSRPHMIAHPAHFLIVKRRIKGRHHHIRVFLLQHDPRLHKFRLQKRIPQQINSGPRIIFLQIIDGRLAGSHDPVLSHIQSHPMQLLHIDCRILR